MNCPSSGAPPTEPIVNDRRISTASVRHSADLSISYLGVESSSRGEIIKMRTESGIAVCSSHAWPHHPDSIPRVKVP